jgi:hypothetical protein
MRVHLPTPIRYRISLAVQLDAVDTTDTQLVATLSTDGTAHLFPDTDAAQTAFSGLSQSVFMHAIDRESGRIQGYRFTTGPANGTTVVAVPTWSIRFDPEVERIAAVGFKRNSEKVNSLGEILGDRSVIHKWVSQPSSRLLSHPRALSPGMGSCT